MGWIYEHKPVGVSIYQHFSNKFNFKTENAEAEVLDCAVVNIRTAYIALRISNPSENRVIGVVCHLDYVKDDYLNFGYKDEEENMGPTKAECPERILNKLTPTDNKVALNWREQCWQNIKKKKSKPRLKEGMIIKLERPISFGNGDKKSIFKVVSPKKLIFSDIYGSQKYKIKRRTLNNVNFEVISYEKARELA